MNTSVRWLNDYLDPPADAAEQAELLTRAGFPLEESTPVDDDVRQDYEMTSNRGDCVCHVGLAREIAAISGRTLKMPAAAPNVSGPAASGLVTVTNHDPEGCPRYTARVIRGVTVAPSPPWLQQRLLARGDIPRNNVVDATNFVLFELGQPTHVFDLAKLKGAAINIRRARDGETFVPIGEDAKGVRLTADDLVIADAEDAVAMAGVKGGAGSAVTEATTDIVIEAATFDPVGVRNSSRRHGIGSDSSYRFERGVHPAQVDAAAERLVALLLELAGGELCAGVVADGAAIPAPRDVAMRPERCRRLLGIPIEDATMVDALDRLGFAPRIEGDVIACTAPVHRLDIVREVDLIEEVSRMHGHDTIPIAETIELKVAAPQPSELARRAVHDGLAGMGFIESITHSLVSETAAAPFIPPGASALRVRDGRAGAESVLRPSLLPSLLRVRGHNQHGGVTSLSLFESAATFRIDADGSKRERLGLGLVTDGGDDGSGLRRIRGAIERLAAMLVGNDAAITVAANDGVDWYAPGAVVSLDGRAIGRMGLVASAIQAAYDLDHPIAAAELELHDLYDDYPPDAEPRPLPSVPAIERDVSAIVDEAVSWAALETAIGGLDLPDLEAVEFITTFRGRSVPAGRKSLSLRCRFRAADRTLTHDEIDPRMERVMEGLVSAFGAEIVGRTRPKT